MFDRPIPRDENDQLNWLRLIRSANLGPVSFWKLMEQFETAEAVLDALPSLSKYRKKEIAVAKPSSVAREVDELLSLGGTLIDYGHDDYPPLLRQLEDAPPVLMALGRTQLLKKRSIAIVGARNASANGLMHARDFASALGQQGFLITSGLARGIDAAAHEGALHSGTAALVGGGIDVVYPRSNQLLYDKIREAGVIASEMPLGCQPQARHFPRRNRLVSGMSRGVLVIEASLRSGSMITARLAQEQGRETMAIPGNPVDPRSKGCNQLIKSGAALIESPDDILEQLHRPFENQEPPGTKTVSSDKRNRSGTSGLNAEPKPTAETEIVNIPVCPGSLSDLLGAEPVAVDDLARQSGIPLAELNSRLMELELEGTIERVPGNRVIKIVPGGKGGLF